MNNNSTLNTSNTSKHLKVRKFRDYELSDFIEGTLELSVRWKILESGCNICIFNAVSIDWSIVDTSPYEEVVNEVHTPSYEEMVNE